MKLLAPTEYYRTQQAIAATTAAAAKKVAARWARTGNDFDAGWAQVRGDLGQLVQVGRAAVVATSVGYTQQVLAETGQQADPAGDLVQQRFLATAPDGRDLGSLLDLTPAYAKAEIGRGGAVGDAFSVASSWLVSTVLTVMADTGRGVVSADIALRPALGGYVRMLNPPSCERCAILAGKWFRWNEGFQRHPRCDCRHIPAAEDLAGDLRTDPYEYFRSLDPKAQEKLFGRSEARAIREGADIYRVMNTKMRGLGTAAGARRFGTPTRMTVDDIYRVAGTRTNAIRLLRQEGFITGPQTRDGNIVGRMHEAYTAPVKRLVAGSNRDRTLQARATGVRDPLDRATMTSAERRLFDARYRLEYAEATGRLPASIVNPRGLRGSDADRYSSFQGVKVTPALMDQLRTQYAAEAKRAAEGTASQRALLAELETNGAAGIPPVPPAPRPPAGGEMPDDDDTRRAELERRYGISFGADALQPHELRFYERFLDDGHQIQPIARHEYKPVNDFIWNGVEVELKSPAQPTYAAAARLVRHAVIQAAKQGVVKDSFIIDLRGAALTPQLRAELAGYNTDFPHARIRNLWAYADTGIERIRLT